MGGRESVYSVKTRKDQKELSKWWVYTGNPRCPIKTDRHLKYNSSNVSYVRRRPKKVSGYTDTLNRYN